MKKNNVKRILSMILAMAMSLTLCVPAFAAEKEYESTQSITIHFNPNECNVNAYALSDAGRGNDAQFNSADVQRFFADNNLDLDYYRKWVYNQDTNNLSTVTITVVAQERNVASVQSNRSISGCRLVYVDRNYHYNGEKVQLTVGALVKRVVSEAVTLYISKYSQVIGSLASICGITNPDTFFGNDLVRKGKEYYIHDGSNRVVTKFVELYAPVQGTTKWYAWGFAEGDYVRQGAQLYYKGIEVGQKGNDYHQYYTQNYYNEATLKQLVKDAYSKGREYKEIADEYAANIGGYRLYDCVINANKYLEYDGLVTN